MRSVDLCVLGLDLLSWVELVWFGGLRGLFFKFFCLLGVLLLVFSLVAGVVGVCFDFGFSWVFACLLLLGVSVVSLFRLGVLGLVFAVVGDSGI